jgi:hypothetical protein
VPRRQTRPSDDARARRLARTCRPTTGPAAASPFSTSSGADPLSQQRIALAGDPEPSSADARAEPRARNLCRTRCAANAAAAGGGDDRRAVLQDGAGILRVTKRADVSTTAADRDAPLPRAAVQEERHVGRRPIQVAARRARSQRLPVVVQQEASHTGCTPAAVDVSGRALEVECPRRAGRGASQCLRDGHPRKSERDEERDGS